MAKNTCCGDQSRGSAAVSASQIGIVGSDCKSSMSRWITTSARPAEVTGDPTQDHAQHDGERHGDHPDGHGRAGAVHESRPLIAPQPIGAQEMDAVAAVRRGRAEEVDPGRHDPEHVVRMPRTKNRTGIFRLSSDAPLHPERRGIAPADDRGDPGAQPRAVEEAEPLHRDEGQPRVRRLGVLRTDELGEQHHRVEDQQHHALEGQAVLPEPPPHQRQFDATEIRSSAG